MTQAKPFVRIILAILVAVVGFVFFAQKIIFVNADLGRHLENGKVFFQNFKPVSTNYYSYTEPDRLVVNHHWGTGVLFYLIFILSGFKGLSVFYCLTSAATLLLFYRVAEKRSHSFLAFLFFMLCIPVISDRVEIRPELFSMLMLGIYVYLLDRHKAGSLTIKKLLIFIPVLQLLWVNLHLFFPMGLLIIAIYGVQEMIGRTGKAARQEALKEFSLLLGLSVVVCLANPAGLTGALVPLTIFRNYAYMIAENQSIFFMQERFNFPVYIHFEILILLVLVLVLLLLRAVKRNSTGSSVFNRMSSRFSELSCLLVFSVLAFKAIRGIPACGYMVLAFAPVLLFDTMKGISAGMRKKMLALALLTASVLFLVSIFGSGTYFSVRKDRSGLGLYTEVNNSAKFFNALRLEGPVFNNYDIGSYLIFSLFPRERVFVDNRPEAYSTAFFEKTYNPMLEKEDLWLKEDSLYRFNCIYFFRLDETPFGQPFLLRRLADHAHWAPVYVDGATIIFLKRIEKNNAVIQQYELPPEMFQSRPNVK